MIAFSLRPGRLFWKLFGFFTLAILTSFLAGITAMTYIAPRAVPPNIKIDAPVQIARLIQKQGVAGALPLLRGEEPDGVILLLRDNGRVVAGNRNISRNATQMLVQAPGGERYRVLVQSYRLKSRNVIPLSIGVTVSLLFSVAVAWYLSRPIILLSRGFSAVGAGQLGTRVNPMIGGRRDEIADLTREFDNMAAQLEQLLASQERLFHDVSHELRSPLARLQVAIGLLRQSPDRHDTILPRIENEAGRLDQLIGELLTLARLESRTTELMLTRIDIIDLLSAIVDDADFEARAKGCSVTLEAASSFVTVADGELMYRAFENIIRNAVKFSPPGEAVAVTADIVHDILCVVVSDAGPGVPPNQIASIFEPFKRGAASDPSGEGGFGLGLAIAKYAVEHHDGEITAACPANGTGLSVDIKIPKQN